ncbi:LysR substrate-binding domain-containing protein [Vibrio sonorensis]|uniref:LysR substrate-binding domain-containing protein n=1 Tax=Vibrio sonorensis TaxID=1004316 RepID=UPI0008DAA765|nr:LysR substrate-binding domain-containing protein [Vibrio sonorensis]
MNKQQLLRNLHTFSVAAKSLSFTHTANKLHLTQGAVSHRIKVLEQELGFNLFIRGTRQLTLTKEGEKFKSTLDDSLSAIFGQIEEIKTGELHGEISIGASTSFANGWLVPKLKDFKEQYPNFNLNILVKENETDFYGPNRTLLNNLDIVICYGGEHYPDMKATPLLKQQFIPVCSPDYAEKFSLFEDGYAALKQVNFLHSLESNAWQRWIKYMDLDVDLFKQFYCVGIRGLDVTAAKHSLGLALGRSYLVEPLLESGELVSPFPSMPSSKLHSIVVPLGTEKRAKIQIFTNWLLGQMKDG